MGRYIIYVLFAILATPLVVALFDTFYWFFASKTFVQWTVLKVTFVGVWTFCAVYVTVLLINILESLAP